jgi:hypothetical protein
VQHARTLLKKVRASEAGLNAELRALTEQTRKLREELREMISPPAREHARGFMHARAWPKATSNDAPPARRRKK